MRINDRGNGIGRIMKPIDEFKRERQPQCENEAQQLPGMKGTKCVFHPIIKRNGPGIDDHPSVTML